VEYLHGEDGEDRLRRRDGWEDFVLEKHERFVAAQNDGPSMQPQSQHHMQQMPMPPHMDPAAAVPFASQQVRSPSTMMPAMNGEYHAQSAATYAPIPSLDGQAGDQPSQVPFPRQMQDQSRRESTTSPLSQAESGQRASMPFSPNHRPSGGMINGHRRQLSRNFNEENVFPDEAIASINICVREPLPDSSTEDQAAMPGMARVLSNESRGSNADVPPVSIPPRISGLRGGAASPEQ
jgi:la-related protein 1